MLGNLSVSAVTLPRHDHVSQQRSSVGHRRRQPVPRRRPNTENETTKALAEGLVHLAEAIWELAAKYAGAAASYLVFDPARDSPGGGVETSSPHRRSAAILSVRSLEYRAMWGKFLAVAGVSVGIIVLPVAAHADTGNGAYSGPQGDEDASAFWVDVSGFLNGTPAEAASLATDICGKLQNGTSEGQLIAAGAEDDQTQISKVKFVVHAAEWHYCPRYY